MAYAVKTLATLAKPISNPVKFTGTLYSNQEDILENILKKLAKDKACIVSCSPGFGKTVVALACAAKLGLKTTVFVNRVVLRRQWELAKMTFVPDLDLQFCNIVMGRTIEYSDFVIVDELHQNITKNTFPKFMKIKPNYILGLSATPYRYDIWDKTIPLIFGDIVTVTKKQRKHLVKIIETAITFPYTINRKTSKMDWTDIITKQGNHLQRNKLIVNCILAEPIQYWLILCKRLNQIDILAKLFEEQSDRIVVKAGVNVNYKTLPECILLGTPSRLGVGFDMAQIQGLCLASDIMNYFPQYMGRLRKDKCVILDFVDKNEPFLAHLNKRLAVYEAHKCIIEYYLPY
uniref:Helicase-like protein n=1 Tax=Rhinella marina erythrocytic-like virus TaxID=2859906 RepID=A0A8F6YJ24_9VIRU|nr:helicase-like protein [Rhinella marina erythrocytic-like virus]